MADWTALSVRQPYALLIVRGVKQYEARSWMPASLGTFMVHASSALAAGWRDDPVLLAALAGIEVGEEEVEALPRGAIIGRADVVEILDPDDQKAHDKLSVVDKYLCADGGFTDGLCLWKLEHPRQFRSPVSCKGKLNLWSVPEATLRKVFSDN